MLDVFKSDAFSTVSLTAAILKAPYKPGRIGELRLFREAGIMTTTAVVEEQDGRLNLIQTTPRGAAAVASEGPNKRKARSFLVPHVAKEARINADQVQNVRAFGSEDQVQAVQTLVNQELAALRAEHEVTLEFHRIGALKGLILDADGSTLFNLFTEFGVAQQTKDFALSNANLDVRNEVVAAARLIEDELGADRYTGLRAFCSAGFFDALVGHAQVKESLKYQESAVLRADLRSGFAFAGVMWEEYRGSVSGQSFIPANEAVLFPEGTGIFSTSFAPADFVETVNTVGLPIYAKAAIDEKFQRYVDLHSQQNPMNLCLRPRAVLKVTKS
jgi:hypothetical protein